MAQTAFRLSSILAYREALLEEASQDVARIEGQLHAVRDDLSRVQTSRSSTFTAEGAASEQLGAQLRQTADYLDSLDRRERSLQAEFAQIQQQLDPARAILLERHQAVSALRRLRERQEATARVEANREEQRALDEVAGRQAERRRQQ